MSTANPTPKAFISYSWTNPDHINWVVRLAERLMGDGVEVVLDQWDLKEGHDKYAFMERMVTDSTVMKVIAVCDEAYAVKADSRRGGAGTETQIITPEVYSKVDQEKFIPIVRERDGNGREFLPTYFRTRIYIDFSNDDKFEESYEKLLRNIFGQPERRKPPLGEPPSHIFNATTHVKPAGTLEQFKDAVKRGRPHAEALLKEYLDKFREDLEDFRMQPTRNDPETFDDALVRNITDFIPYRDNFIDFSFFAAEFVNDSATYDEIFTFFEEIISYRFRKEGMGGFSDWWCDNYVFIERELFLYFLAVLIKSRRYEVAARFIESEYHFKDILGGARYRQDGVEIFNYNPVVLEDHRKKRLNLNSFSVTANLIMERATHPKVKAAELIQADLLPFIRAFFPQPGACRNWFPHCIGFARRAGTLDLFAKVTSSQGFVGIQKLLKVNDLESLLVRSNAMFMDDRFKRTMNCAFHFGIDWKLLLNTETIVDRIKRDQKS